MRHIGAYIDLAGLDLARTQREITAQVVASAIVAICALFAVFLICLGVIAYYLGHALSPAPPLRGWAADFVLVAIAAAIYRAQRRALAIAVARPMCGANGRKIGSFSKRILSSDED